MNQQSLCCPHCSQALFRQSVNKLKARTSIVVLSKAMDVEINCAHCGNGVVLGRLAAVELRKAAPRLVLRPLIG